MLKDMSLVLVTHTKQRIGCSELKIRFMNKLRSCLKKKKNPCVVLFFKNNLNTSYEVIQKIAEKYVSMTSASNG